MNKREFIESVGKEMEGLSVEQKMEFIEAIQEEWIPELRREAQRGYVCCENCKKYILDSEFNFEASKEARTSTYSFNHNVWGKVMYSVLYRVCPSCGAKEEEARELISTG